MQAALPLVRSARNATVKASPSRIPHLEYHILRKFSRHRRSGSNHGARQQLRHRNTIAHASPSLPSWPTADFESPFLEHATDALQDDASCETTRGKRVSARSATVDFTANQITQPSSFESAGYVSLGSAPDEISASKLLEEANPERLLTWLTAHASGKAFIKVAENTEFERAFCAIDPEVLVEPFKQAQKHMRESKKINDHELSFERSLVRRLRRFANSIDFILVNRQEAGVPLTLRTCQHALRCAASVGDLRMANHIWDTVMPNNDVEPDLKCYNAYAHARLWNLAHSEIASVSHRNTKRNLELRSKIWRPKNLLGWMVSPEDREPEPSWALRAQVLAMFQDITNKGFVTDEETFTNLMIGLARGGDIAGVDSVLKSVWNIDVNALSNFDEEELESPTYYAESHPLKPSAKLLSAIVHCYTINNSAEKAWTILDYTSRNYALDIPESIWTELFEWTFVLSIHRSSARKKQGQSAGKIPRKEVENLYNTMTDAPHNVKPNAIVLSMRAKNYRQRRVLDKTLDTLRHLEKDMMQHLEQIQLMVDTIKAVARNPRGITDNGIISQKFLDFRRDFQMAYLTAIQQYDVLILESKRIIKENDWAGSGKQQTWQRERLPQVIEELQAYLPSYIEYNTRTGRVALHLSEHRGQALQEGPVRNLLFEATQIWHALESQDLFRLAENLRQLPEELGALQYQRTTRHRPFSKDGT